MTPSPSSPLAAPEKQEEDEPQRKRARDDVDTIPMEETIKKEDGAIDLTMDGDSVENTGTSTTTTTTTTTTTGKSINREMTATEKKMLEVAKNKLSKWAARLFDPNRRRGLIEPPQIIPLNDEFLQAFGRREKETDAATGRSIDIDKSNLDDDDNKQGNDSDSDNDVTDGRIVETPKKNLGPLLGRKVKVVNLSYTTTSETLEKACESFGVVVDTNLILNRDTAGTDQPRNIGRAYVTFETAAGAEACLANLGKIDGRQPRVFMAEEQTAKSAGQPFGGGGGGGAASSRYWDVDISTKCFRCGQVGHIEANCPNEAKQRPCPLCGKTDHDMRFCELSKICFRCGLPGHISRDCPTQQHVPRRMICAVCFQSGHYRTDCHRVADQAPCTDGICMVCGDTGHFMCKEMKWFFGVSAVYCFNCGQEGHVGFDCNRARVRECSQDEGVVRREWERAEAMAL